jgi:hypothetical protein
LPSRQRKLAFSTKKIQQLFLHKNWFSRKYQFLQKNDRITENNINFFHFNFFQKSWRFRLKIS